MHDAALYGHDENTRGNYQLIKEHYGKKLELHGKGDLKAQVELLSDCRSFKVHYGEFVKNELRSASA